MKRVVFTALVVLGTLSLGGCKGAPPAQTAATVTTIANQPTGTVGSPVATPGDNPVTPSPIPEVVGGQALTQTVGALTAVLVIAPFPPVPMEEASLQLTVRDASGQPFSGAKVLFDLTMPSMMMPRNTAEVTDQGDGVYTARVVFTMGGAWSIGTYVKRDGETAQAFYPLDIK